MPRSLCLKDLRLLVDRMSMNTTMVDDIVRAGGRGEVESDSSADPVNIRVTDLGAVRGVDGCVASISGHLVLLERLEGQGVHDRTTTDAGFVFALAAPELIVPTSMNQCRDRGWLDFPQFNNQGAGVSFVEQDASRP